MTESVLVEVSGDHSRFSLKGGDPRAKDEVFGVVTKWPGWKRINVPAIIDGLRLGHYQAPVWAHTAAQLSNTTMRVQWGEGARDVVAKAMDDLLYADRKLHEDLEEPRKHLGTERKPMRHQAQAVAAIGYMHNRALLADDMGLGKTSTSLWAAMHCERILILCPASVKFNWQREVKTTLDRPCYVIDGTPKKRASVFADILHAMNYSPHDPQPAPFTVVINYDLLIQLSDLQTDVIEGLVTGQALICDESHYLKSRDAARTKWVLKHLAPAKGGATTRILCTGTPVRNLIDDLYSQVEIIRPGTWTSYWDFSKRYLDIAAISFGGPRTVQKIVGTTNLPELNKIVNTLQIRRITDKVIDLPPKIFTYPELELEGDHLKV
ncbi:MAG: SNF2-related protein, partial [Dehalococcoidia bacterium]